ncbi:Immunogenic protein 3 [Dirofilaria immitis]|nr:Immunogenic protein 3 [Dirofilaria immitis]
MFQTTIGCDIILRVKSLTETPFKAQIIAPNGKTNEKKILNKNERLIFQQKADECGLGPFQIKTFSKGSDSKFEKEEYSVEVTLNGIGVVNYEVGNDLKPKQIFRQGAECEGQCAPLGVTHHHHHHHHHHQHDKTTTMTTAKA